MILNYRIIPSTKDEREKIRKIQRSKYSSEKECIYCHEKFDYGYSSLKSCLACKIIVKCCNCGNEFELIFSNYSGNAIASIKKAIKDKKPIIAYCSKQCSTKNNILKAHEQIKYLYENDAEWAENQRNNNIKNIQKANEYHKLHPEIKQKLGKQLGNKFGQKMAKIMFKKC